MRSWKPEGGVEVHKLSFDLYFCRQDERAPSLPELHEYFSRSPLFQIENIADGGVEFWYRNEATGVYCSFSNSPLDAAELEGCGSSGLTFNLNYCRPSFFAYETMPLVESFCKSFGLIVEDPQDETIQAADASRLISSWRRQNAKAIDAIRETAKGEDVELHFLPKDCATAWWHYMRLRQGIEESIAEDIFVPTLLILMSPARELFTMMVWPKGISQFFPSSDCVYVQREKKGMFGAKEEFGMVPYGEVKAMVGDLLDDYEFEGFHFKFLRPDKTTHVARLIKTLHLETVDLSRYTRMASDSFHDVAPGEAAD